jgi:acetyl-CoA carboxylase beta subunit
MHEDEILSDARDRMHNAERSLEYDGKYFDCPGCDRLVHHSDLDAHPERCRALRDLVTWEATGAVREEVADINGALAFVGDAQAARMLARLREIAARYPELDRSDD